MNKIRSFLFTILSFFLLLSLSSATAAEVGKMAPDFTLQTLEGKNFKLSDYRGKKAIYITFWATWCSNCEAEIPELKEIQAKYSDDIMLLAINTSINDSMKRMKKYVKKHDLTYQVAFDEGSQVTKNYKVMGTPTQVIIDVNGILRYQGTDIPHNIGERLDYLMDRKHAE